MQGLHRANFNELLFGVKLKRKIEAHQFLLVATFRRFQRLSDRMTKAEAISFRASVASIINFSTLCLQSNVGQYWYCPQKLVTSFSLSH